MPLSAQERVKAQQLIEKLENCSFGCNDVEGLLIKLRGVAGRCNAIREVADMVAHPEKGQSGSVRDNQRRMFFRFKFYREYVISKKLLNIDEEFPSYIWELMKYDIDYCDNDELLELFGFSHSNLRKKIESHFKYDKIRKVCTLKRPIGLKLHKAIDFLLSRIVVAPSFTDQDFIEQLVATSKSNKLKFDEAAIRENDAKIILCMILLLHNRLHGYERGRHGRCFIAAETPVNVGPDPSVVGDIDKKGLGYLQVLGTVDVDTDTGVANFLVPVVGTSLLVSEWVDESVFILEQVPEPSPSDNEHFFVLRLDSGTDLYVNDDSLIAKIETESE